MSSRDDQETYKVFIDVLRSAGPIPLPSGTLYGAITHYLSSLPVNQLAEFVRILVESPSLQRHADADRRSLREAAALSISAKQSSLQNQYVSAWLGPSRRNRELNSWLLTVSTAALEATRQSSPRGDVLYGLLRGHQDVQSGMTGTARVRLEEEVVLMLAEKWENRQEDGFAEDLSYVIDGLHPRRLLALDAKVRIHLKLRAVWCFEAH